MAKKDIINEVYGRIQREISSNLTYHGLHHTMDVHDVCKSYIRYYSIEEKEAELLEIAAVSHDLGFVHTYHNHENVSAVIIGSIMTKYGYSQAEIVLVKKMIMATKIPQTPEGKLSEILCDADLDYLGRDDFEEISQSLKKEWAYYNIVDSLDEQFDRIQINFLENHKFHTSYAKEHRHPVMIKHLKALKAKYPDLE